MASARARADQQVSDGPASRHVKKRYWTRRNHESVLKIVTTHGDEQISDIRFKTLVLWHDEWSEGGTS
jgi:hypothetical protein